MTVMDRRLTDLDPSPVTVAWPLVSARAAIGRATAELLSIPDSALEREWSWRYEGQGDSDIRSGFYIAAQGLNGAAGELDAIATSGGRPAPGPAIGSIAVATTARWDLQGLLAPLDDDALDTDPGGDEWTIRQTLDHALASQRAYTWFTAWWAGRGDEPDFPRHAPESLADELPPDNANGSGTMAEVRNRLDALLDLSTELYRDATAEQLARPARWSGFPLTVGFRVGRWGPHLEEHTIQVEKTLAMLGRQPTETERLVRVIHRAMGRMEAAAAGLPPSVLEGEAGPVIESAAAEVEAIAHDIAGVAAA